jgi:hypothetical protein
MSKINNTNNSMNNNNNTKKPFCKVCKDAKKTEKEYSSHYPKDGNGQVICPTLLNQACRFCTVKGHTVSFCALAKAQKEKEEKERERERARAKMPFCKFCKDAGKPEEVYSSHYVKDRDIVICPTLLNATCGFCCGKGHTTSHCDEPKRQFEKKEKERLAFAALPSAKTAGSWANKLVAGKCDPNILDKIKKAEDEDDKRIQDAKDTTIKEKALKKANYEAREADKIARIAAKFDEELNEIKRKYPHNWQWKVEGTDYDIDEAWHYREDFQAAKEKDEEEWNKKYELEREIIRNTMTDEEWFHHEQEADDIWSNDPNGNALLSHHGYAFRAAVLKQNQETKSRK